MKVKGSGAVSIIGGADGPTSVFLVGKSKKRTLKEKLRGMFYKHQRKAAEKKITAQAHTLKEVVSFAQSKYSFTETDHSQRRYTEKRECLKERLIIENRPDLLGDLREIVRPKVYDENGIRELHRQIQARTELIAGIPDEEIPMDYHIYEIEIKEGHLEMGIDYRWNIFGISYSGSKRTMKHLKKIAKELYLYYGVTKEDMECKSERYSALVTELCT